METLFIYLLKASALLAVYFLAYHFLLRKETFFTTNRWFLLAGMITSGVMPLLFITKIVLVERPKAVLNELAQYSDYSALPVEEAASIDWFQLTAIGYILISLVLFVKILTHLASLFKLLHKKEVVKKEQFSLVDLNEDIAPFSFFNYIVYNSKYYTNDELHSILLHEKIHSQEKHSIDVMLAKLFCIVFWFNPFMWLYKKAITQNLEYIADQKAIQHIEDKKVYQKALLKVVTHQNYLSITSHFYQSLIKKRIVMLNKNQSKKSNSWKYALVLPVLIAFVIFFQVKVIAQEKRTALSDDSTISSSSQQITEMIWTKNSSDEELKKDVKFMKKEGVDIKFSELKRNSNREITGIKVEFKDESGKTGIIHIAGDHPIKPIYFQKSEDHVGFGKSSTARIASINGTESDDEYEIAPIAAIEIPEPPTPPTPPMHPYQNMMEAPNAPDFPRFPEAPEFPSDVNDEKAMAQYEKSMVSFEKKMKKAEKEFESKMEVFERNMNENDPKMQKFEREMEKFEEDMERFQEQLEEKLEREIEYNVERNINKEGKVSEKHIQKARKEAMKARKEAMEDRKEAMRDREEAMRDREEAIKVRKEIRKEVRKTE